MRKTERALALKQAEEEAAREEADMKAQAEVDRFEQAMKNAERLAAENEAKRTATSLEDAAKLLESMPESQRSELVKIAAEQETARLKAQAEEAERLRLEAEENVLQQQKKAQAAE